MTTTSTDTITPADHVRCGCCGRSLPTARVTELGETPGVYICSRCALWAAGRLSRFPIVELDPRRLLRRLRPGGRQRGEAVLRTIPILPTTDLDRTCAYYQSLGFAVVERSDGYMVMHAQGVEMHFSTGSTGSSRAASSRPVEVFVHVGDSGRLWKRLKAEGVAGLGPVVDQPWGLREFVATDPDGNRVRVGSPVREE